VEGPRVIASAELQHPSLSQTHSRPRCTDPTSKSSKKTFCMRWLNAHPASTSYGWAQYTKIVLRFFLCRSAGHDFLFPGFARVTAPH
jgi:hypothetical protein